MNKQSWARIDRITDNPTPDDDHILFQLISNNKTCYLHFSIWSDRVCDSRLKRSLTPRSNGNEK